MDKVAGQLGARVVCTRPVAPQPAEGGVGALAHHVPGLPRETEVVAPVAVGAPRHQRRLHKQDAPAVGRPRESDGYTGGACRDGDKAALRVSPRAPSHARGRGKGGAGLRPPLVCLDAPILPSTRAAWCSGAPSTVLTTSCVTSKGCFEGGDSPPAPLPAASPRSARCTATWRQRAAMQRCRPRTPASCV